MKKSLSLLLTCFPVLAMASGPYYNYKCESIIVSSQSQTETYKSQKISFSGSKLDGGGYHFTMKTYLPENTRVFGEDLLPESWPMVNCMNCERGDESIIDFYSSDRTYEFHVSKQLGQDFKYGEVSGKLQHSYYGSDEVRTFTLKDCKYLYKTN